MFRFLLACVGLLVFFGTAAQAQGWTVARLKVAGAEVPGTTVELRQPGGAMQTRELRVQQMLAPGTELKARAEVEIELQSPGRMRAMKEAGDAGTLVLAAVSSAGERVEVKAGLWGFKRISQAVGQALSPFSASAGSGTASTPGTEFTVAVDEQGGVARFAVQEGRVQMNWPEQVEVQATGTPQGQAASTRRSVRRLLRAGDPAVTVPLNPSGWLMRYTDYNDALSAFAGQLRDAEARQDQDAVFEALLAQADMLVLAGRPQEALAPLQRAQDMVNGPSADDTYWRAVAIGRRGGALQALNRYGEAALAFVEARHLHAQVPPREGERTGVEQSGNIASNLLADGAARCADTWAARLLAALDAEQAGPARHIRVPLMGIRGDAAATLQQPDQARRWHDQAL